MNVVIVRIENHGAQPLYLTGSVSFDRDEVADKHFFVTRDVTGYWWPEKKALAPGGGFDIPIPINDPHAPRP